MVIKNKEKIFLISGLSYLILGVFSLLIGIGCFLLVMFMLLVSGDFSPQVAAGISMIVPGIFLPKLWGVCQIDSSLDEIKIKGKKIELNTVSSLFLSGYDIAMGRNGSTTSFHLTLAFEESDSITILKTWSLVEAYQFAIELQKQYGFDLRVSLDEYFYDEIIEDNEGLVVIPPMDIKAKVSFNGEVPMDVSDPNTIPYFIDINRDKYKATKKHVALFRDNSDGKHFQVLETQNQLALLRIFIYSLGPLLLVVAALFTVLFGGRELISYFLCALAPVSVWRAFHWWQYTYTRIATISFTAEGLRLGGILKQYGEIPWRDLLVVQRVFFRNYSGLVIRVKDKEPFVFTCYFEIAEVIERELYLYLKSKEH